MLYTIDTNKPLKAKQSKHDSFHLYSQRKHDTEFTFRLPTGYMADHRSIYYKKQSSPTLSHCNIGSTSTRMRHTLKRDGCASSLRLVVDDQGNGPSQGFQGGRRVPDFSPTCWFEVGEAGGPGAGGPLPLSLWACGGMVRGRACAFCRMAWCLDNASKKVVRCGSHTSAQRAIITRRIFGNLHNDDAHLASPTLGEKTERG
jgi:hypothetical protein